MNATDYTPEPGSPADRVLDLLARNPQEEYSSSDLALKFQVPKAKWDILLVEAVAKGLIHREKLAGESSPTWCAGAGLKVWAAQRKGAAMPPSWNASEAKTKRPRAAAPLLAPLDFNTLTVEAGGQIVQHPGPKIGSKWDPLFALLQAPNTSVAVPLAYKGTLAAWVKKRKKDGRLNGAYTVGTDAADRTKCRVLRTA